MNIPLVGSFNDWFDFNNIIHPLLRPALEKLFASFTATAIAPGAPVRA